MLDDGTTVDIRGCSASFYPEGIEALLFADPAQFGADLSGLRQKMGHSFEVSVLVR
jgi:hypothetical protein